MRPRSLSVGLLAPPWVAVPPPAYGGTESVVSELARGLVAAGHDVMLYATGDSTAPACQLNFGWSQRDLRHPSGVSRNEITTPATDGPDLPTLGSRTIDASAMTDIGVPRPSDWHPRTPVVSARAIGC
jgi:hypothetical protein